MPKKILLTAFLIAAACFRSAAQEINYKSVSNRDLTYVLNNIQKRYVYTDHKTLNIAVYLVADLPGSAAVAGCSTSSSIYVAVSGMNGMPEQHVYRLSSVCSPRFMNWIKSKKMYKVAFSYGAGLKRKTATIGIMLNRLVTE